MTQYIDKAAVVAEIEKRIDELYNMLPDTSKVEDGIITISEACNTGKYTALESFKDYLDTLEVKEENSVWHNIDDTPNYNLNGISDFIIDSCYGHIYGEAHSYTPEQWSAHIGFNANRQFRWAYEKDLINFE